MFDRLKYFFINNKRPLLIAAAVLILIIIVVSFFPFGKKEEKAAAPKINGAAAVLNGAKAREPAEATAEEKANAAVFVVAKNFAEIYGTYSNQSNFSNLESVMGLLTLKYRAEMESFLRQVRLNFRPESVYKGITTLTINTVIESLNETSGTARATVKTQRQESGFTSPVRAVKYQDIRLDLAKEGGRWLVDNAEWVK